MLKNIPVRKCVACGNMADKDKLFRIVKYDGQISLDKTQKANGRGAYICPDIDCLTKAVRNGSLSRALGCGIPQEVFESLRKEIEGLD